MLRATRTWRGTWGRRKVVAATWLLEVTTLDPIFIGPIFRPDSKKPSLFLTAGGEIRLRDQHAAWRRQGSGLSNERRRWGSGDFLARCVTERAGEGHVHEAARSRVLGGGAVQGADAGGGSHVLVQCRSSSHVGCRPPPHRKIQAAAEAASGSDGVAEHMPDDHEEGEDNSQAWLNAPKRG
ncbi:chromatin assembly factor-1 [Striga asiatica]|uniref:Chromatin assembly factor-1 n=1 Tax=Striga asiatica TaxID=4170 RepID=A0A5A7P8K6_STRAF|nr:chromatin assembly factor-1 [Striga asiatica]